MTVVKVLEKEVLRNICVYAPQSCRTAAEKKALIGLNYRIYPCISRPFTA